MKTKKRLLVLTLLLMSILSQAQTIDPASEWRVDSYVAEPGYMNQNYYKNYIDGDTMINSIEYFKVYASGYSYTEWVPPGYYNYFEHALSGFLREENNKWYTFYENQDALLFDFTLDINDTVYSAYTFFIDSPLIVSGIDSIQIDGQYKRRLHLNADPSIGAEYIIEGIGATSGLFENMIFFEWGSELVCFAKEGNSLWGASTEECDLAVKINETEGTHIPCSVFPNPGQDFTIVSIPVGFGKVTFTLIDIVGRIVHQDSFGSPSTNKIQLNSYHPGIYLAVIESIGLRQAVKLIIE